jgi:hypothetical protein
VPTIVSYAVRCAPPRKNSASISISSARSVTPGRIRATAAENPAAVARAASRMRRSSSASFGRRAASRSSRRCFESVASERTPFTRAPSTATGRLRRFFSHFASPSAGTPSPSPAPSHTRSASVTAGTKSVHPSFGSYASTQPGFSRSVSQKYSACERNG